MNNEIFKRIISDNSNHKFDPYIRLLCISGSNLQWLKMMINSHFSNCKSYNSELLEIKSIQEIEPPEPEIGVGRCEEDVMSEIEGLEEIKIYYNNIDITDYFLGTFEDIKTSSSSEGGPLGLSYLSISFRSKKIIDFTYKYIVKSFEYRGTDVPDTFYEGCFDSALEKYCSFVGKSIKKNIFTICSFDKSDICDLYHCEALSTEKCNEILKKHLNIKTDEELIERFEDIDVIWQ